MEQENGRVENERPVLELKLPEPEVTSDKPWQDDVLNRKDVADRLTNIIRNQTLPFVISIHGEWGTGKTFMLRRWQKDLEIQGFVAIYFNAWEDDFCDDPLLAILGQLAGHFKEDRLKRMARRAVEVALPLIRENIFGMVKATTGVTLKAHQERKAKTTFLDAYLEQKEAKENLKNHLTVLSSEVSKNDEPPLVFIIDELDRCRPTFAIELLERVKHIFDVPNMVFVLGVNRDELCKSFQSIYGEIDADVYIRRFFDLEFNLPKVDTANYCQYLMRKLEISDFFFELGRKDIFGRRRNEAEEYYSFFTHLWSYLGFSLRDMDYCIRTISLVGNSTTQGSTTFPWILGLLIALKLKNPRLYRQFIEGKDFSSKLLDFIDEEMSGRDLVATNMSQGLDRIEGYLYRAEANSTRHTEEGASAIEQLKLLQKGEELTHPEYLSNKTKRFGSDRAGSLLQIADGAHYGGVYGGAIEYIAGLIDLQQDS